MIHARPDYSRFQDPALNDPSLLGDGSTPVAEDEPVMLFRAQDKHFVAILRKYLSLIRQDAGGFGHFESEKDKRMTGAIEGHMVRAIKWQEVHPPKTPDMPAKSA